MRLLACLGFETVEEAGVEVVGAGGVVGYVAGEVGEEAVELGGGGVVHGLGEVVLGGVVALGKPLTPEFVLGGV